MTDNTNPFEDPDVQNSVQQTLPPPDNAYGDTSWQNEDNDNQTTNETVQQTNLPPVPNVYDTGTDIAVDVGKQQISNQTDQIQNDYNQSVQNQENQHAPPPTPNWCEKCMNWFPLQWFNLFGGMCVSAFAVIDIIIGSNSTTFIGYIIYFYLFFFGIVIMLIESPSFKLTRSAQIKIYFWFRLISRLWGRGWFYLFIALLCMGEVTPKRVNASFFAGLYLLIMAIISWIVSRAAAKKYQRFYVYIAAGTEGEERDKKFAARFDMLDMDQDGYLVSADIVKLALQASRELANSERHCIQTFLDESCNGKVSKDDFCKMFKDYNMKQRFL